ncbi:MAG: biosynthetic-type acetolactate synthase large subunit [Lachnospiraceae bacterium]|nr:biosynthetic-type acetolactate synthase large subunit [Lachnospiraceae bacterium]
MKISGADIVAKTLIEQGTEVVFGYPGGQVIHLYDALYKHQDQLKHVLTAHEQGASHAADGYARATGKVGVAIATSGPGATNLVTGIATAYLDSIPLVAITGNVPQAQIGKDSFQEVDITGVTMPITKHNFFVKNIEQLADTIREAFKLAKSGRPGPVLVDIPKDVQIAQCEYEPVSVVEPYESKPSCDCEIEAAAEIIKAAKKPFILFGGGGITGDAGKEIEMLADKIDAVIGCSMMGLSAVPTSQPRFLGMVGMHGHYASSLSMHNCDCLIAIGARFSDRATGNTKKFAPDAKIVHIDIDAAEFEKNVRVDACVRGDVKEALSKLVAALPEIQHPEWQAQVDALRVKEAGFDPVDEKWSPKNIIRVMNDYKKPSTPVVTDVGQNQMWAAQYADLQMPRKFISSGGLGTMGFGMGAAIGSAIATKERSVLVTGDGGFGMCLTELATAVTYNVPVTVLILNNTVLGMVRQWQTLFFGKRYSNTDIGNRQTDFVKLAEAFGAKGIRANDEAELRKAFEDANNSDGPVVIECMINKDEFVLPMIPAGGSMDDLIVKVGD